MLIIFKVLAVKTLWLISAHSYCRVHDHPHSFWSLFYWTGSMTLCALTLATKQQHFLMLKYSSIIVLVHFYFCFFNVSIEINCAWLFVFSGYVQSLIRRVVNNVNIVVNNLILKYVEDDIVLSVNITSAECYTVDDIWERAFMDITSKMFSVLGAFSILDKPRIKGFCHIT